MQLIRYHSNVRLSTRESRFNNYRFNVQVAWAQIDTARNEWLHNFVLLLALFLFGTLRKRSLHVGRHIMPRSPVVHDNVSSFCKFNAIIRRATKHEAYYWFLFPCTRRIFSFQLSAGRHEARKTGSRSESHLCEMRFYGGKSDRKRMQAVLRHARRGNTGILHSATV